MPRAPSRRDLRDELVADIEQIEDNIALYKSGRNSAFQTVALQLRNLLLGERRGLLLRVFPSATLQPIKSQPPVEPGQVVLFGNAQFQPPWRGQPGSLSLPIDDDAEPIELSAWLQQWTVRPDVKIGGLIRSTANEEVAHTVDERGPLLEKLAGSGIMAISPSDLEAGRIDRGRIAQETYQLAIVAIGEYVAHRIRQLLSASDQVERQP